jgi:hypothetical protein
MGPDPCEDPADAPQNRGVTGPAGPPRTAAEQWCDPSLCLPLLRPFTRSAGSCNDWGEREPTVNVEGALCAQG